jgi:hypothetical protein
MNEVPEALLRDHESMTWPARFSAPIASGESQQRALRIATLTAAVLLFAAMTSGQPSHQRRSLRRRRF